MRAAWQHYAHTGHTYAHTCTHPAHKAPFRLIFLSVGFMDGAVAVLTACWVHACVGVTCQKQLYMILHELTRLMLMQRQGCAGDVQHEHTLGLILTSILAHGKFNSIFRASSAPLILPNPM